MPIDIKRNNPTLLAVLKSGAVAEWTDMVRGELTTFRIEANRKKLRSAVLVDETRQELHWHPLTVAGLSDALDDIVRVSNLPF